MAGWGNAFGFSPPSSYPKRSGTKATHTPRAKKAKQSLFDEPAFAHGYRAAYSTIYAAMTMPLRSSS